MVFRASLAAQISVAEDSPSETEDGATPQSSAAVVLGVTRGVPGVECEWKEGGGELGIEWIEGAVGPVMLGAWEDGTELGIPVLKL
jgi:hypothetical protein